jgi:predicted transposase/invertase (TIGR01784 family)
MEEEFHEAERIGVLPKEIDRLGDSFLKFLLTTPKRKPILLDLINATLRAVEYEPLVNIEPMDRELTPDVHYGRGLRLDYYGTTDSGGVLNMEFQKYGNEDFVKRAIYCISALIQRQILISELFSKLRQTIFIGLLNFNLFKWDDWCWDVFLSNVEKGKILTKDLLVIFVEMDKLGGVLSGLRKKMERGEGCGSDALTRLALWGGYMTGKGVDIVTEMMAKDEIFSQVLEAEHDFWGDKRNRYMQWRDQKREMDSLSEMAQVKAEAEAKVKSEIVRSMLEEKMPIELIRKISKLSDDEIGEIAFYRLS